MGLESSPEDDGIPVEVDIVNGFLASITICADLGTRVEKMCGCRVGKSGGGREQLILETKHMQ